MHGLGARLSGFKSLPIFLQSKPKCALRCLVWGVGEMTGQEWHCVGVC